jgi:succinate-semialdehyde dehydrogenase/glutarate-semialdehyde dehydrogenase
MIATHSTPLRGKLHSAVEVQEMLTRAEAAQEAWSATSLEVRIDCVRRLGDVLRARRVTLSRLMTTEMGKPIVQAEAEIDKCASACDFYSENAKEFLQPTVVSTAFDESYIQYDPLGIVLAVMPWNFPFWQVIRLLAPAFAAGNAVMLKHASNVPQCAVAIEDAVLSAGFPAGLFRTMLIPPDAVAEVIADPRVAAVCVTGSSEAGAKIAAVAGRHLTKVVLELGGSDAFIVLDDADLGHVVGEAVRSRMLNAGQSCVAAKRFLVHSARLEEFSELFVAAVRRLVVGDPWNRDTDIGPLARPDLVESIERQVSESIAMGARLLVGGQRDRAQDRFYPPTVLADVRPGMPVFSEETFGPVAAVTSAADDDELVALANASNFGLGASIWTGDLDRARKLATRLEVGCVFVNCRVSSDPALPFGGVKDSGYGRELGLNGLRELTNIKAVALRRQPASPLGARPEARRV